MQFSFSQIGQRRHGQSGINMVDLMMWLVIAALLLAAALQSINYYQRAAFSYQAKSDLGGLSTWVMTQASVSGVPTLTDLQKAIDTGDLKLTKNGSKVNTAMLAVADTSYCVGVRAESIAGDNVYYASSKSPSEVKVEASLPTDCGVAAESVPSRTFETIAQDFASLTWEKKSSLAGVYWLGLDSSADGQVLIGGQNNGYVYTSTNGGGTWKKQDLGVGLWWGVTTSSDGQRLTAASLNGVHISEDGGETWRTANLPAGEWTRIASSNDGTRIFVSQHQVDGYVYTSNDSGKTWTQRISSGTAEWQSLAASADGRVVVSGTNNGAMHISRDYGSTWSVVPALGINDWHDADISSDGTRIITGAASGNLYTSSDSGMTWKTETAGGVVGWRGVTTSDDGKVMAAGQRNGYVYTSIDGGQNWVQRIDSGAATWYAITTTSDGSKIMAGQGSTAGNLFVGTYKKS